jgi:aspartyl/asparaginyl-tRNA synthetase
MYPDPYKQKIIDPIEFNETVQKLRSFFLELGWVEAHAQHLTSILAACEDPETIAPYSYSGYVWPLPQTSQMWLEYFLLKNPDLKGVFSVSTSYRNEPNPVPGRHDLRFPMFEFETHGTMDGLVKLEKDLLDYLGFDSTRYVEMDYKDVASQYHPDDAEPELTGDDEGLIWKDHSEAFFLKNFPLYTSPFWNMKKNGDLAKKVDVLLFGIETIGSAERSCDAEEMRHLFHTISDGKYANTIFAQFGRERVLKELEDFLSFDFFPRFGGGIGMTRMIRAMKLLKESKDQ